MKVHPNNTSKIISLQGHFFQSVFQKKNAKGISEKIFLEIGCFIFVSHEDQKVVLGMPDNDMNDGLRKP